eukprot:894208-Pleurochrysis_carterae.AAC.1
MMLRITRWDRSGVASHNVARLRARGMACAWLRVRGRTPAARAAVCDYAHEHPSHTWLRSSARPLATA